MILQMDDAGIRFIISLFSTGSKGLKLILPTKKKKKIVCFKTTLILFKIKASFFVTPRKFLHIQQTVLVKH